MKVIDMHCDTFSEIFLAKEKSLYSNDLNIDIQKMQKGGYLLQNFAMFVPLDRVEDPRETAFRMIDIYNREMYANREHIGRVLSFADIQKNQDAGKLSSMLTIEEGGVCLGYLRTLRKLYSMGVRMITLTWNFENELGYPNTIAGLAGYDPSKRYGLKEFGFQFVEEMERLGMIVDVSHLSDDGFWDVCKVATRPFVASHSNARSLCYHTRNLTDDMVRALAGRGGVTGLNFCNIFLDADKKISTIDDTVRHMRYLANVGGIDCVGLGTDFDGIRNELELFNCSQMPRLADAMARDGFTEAEIEKIFYHNVLRVYKDTLK